MVTRDRHLFGCINGGCPYFGLEQEASEQAAGGEEPQRVELVDEKHRGGAGGGDQPQAPIGAAAGRGEHYATGEDHADDERRDGALDGAAPLGVLEAVPEL